jgi:hypothetical protein
MVKALCLDGTCFFESGDVTGRPGDGIADKGFTRTGCGLQSRSQIHRLADNRVFLVCRASRRAGHNFACGDADMGSQFFVVAGFDDIDRLVDLKCRAHGARGIVGMGNRSAEQCHDVVADVFVDMSAMDTNGIIGCVKKQIQQTMDLFGVQRPGQPGKTRQVGEQNGDLTPLAGRQPGRGRLRGVEW